MNQRYLVQPLLLTLLLVGSFFATVSHASAQLKTGKEFVVALPAFWRQIDLGNPGNFQMTVLCSRQTNVTVKWSGPTGNIIDQATVGAGGRLTIQPPLFNVFSFIQPNEDKSLEQVNQRSFYIQADQPVSVYCYYDDYRSDGSHSEAWAVPPIESYGTSYLGLTYPGSYGKNTGFLLTAAEDGTQVTFTPNAVWDSPSQDSGTPVTITMKKHQVFQILSFQRGGVVSSDLSGTSIVSNKPIGVVAFNLHSNVSHATRWYYPPPPGMRSDLSLSRRLSALADVLPPESQGGKLFYAAPPFGRDTGEIWLMSLAANNSVTVNGVLDTVLQRGERIEIDVPTGTKVETTEMSLAMYLIRSGNMPVMASDTLVKWGSGPNDTITVENVFGNPGMAWLPPVSEYKPSLQWVNPLIDHHKTRIPGHDSILIHPWYHFAMITAPIDAVNSVRLDGQPVDFQFTHIDGQFKTAVVNVLPRPHVVTADAPVSCIGYGMGYNDGYAMVSGEALRSVAKLTPSSILASSCDTTIQVEFDLTNLGNNNYRIDSIRAEGIEIRSVVSPIGFPTEMPPGRQLTAKLWLRLPQTRSYSGTIRVYTDANNISVLELPFTIVRDSARLSYPSTVDFGLVPSDETTHDTTITITNSGNSPLTITDLQFDNAQFSLLGPTTPFTLPPGGSKLVQVRITPRQGVPESARLRIVGNPCFSPVDIGFTGFKGSGPLLGISRAVDFGAYQCQNPGPIDTTLIIESTGGEPLEITGSSISGGPPGTFKVVGGFTPPVTLLPGAKDSIIVRYIPGTYGVHQGQLTLVTNAQNASNPLTINLNGRLDTAMLSPQRSSLVFDTLLSCDDPIEMDVQIKNDGTVDAEVSSATITGGNGAFSVVTATPLPVAAFGGTRTIRVRFAPSSDGTFNGTLQLNGGPCGLSESVALSGTRISPALSTTTTSLRFDTLYSCTEPGEQSLRFTLKNDGTVPDTLVRFSPSGSDAFTLSPVDFPVVLLPGESREYTVRFAPTVEGALAGSVEFVWGPCDTTMVVNFSGVYIDPRIELSSKDINFGTVQFDDAEVTQTVRLRNSGVVQRTIDLDLQNNPDVRLISPTLPKTLGPGEEIELVFGYDPTVAGTLDMTGDLEVSGPCETVEQIRLQGLSEGEEIIDVRIGLEIPDDLKGMVDSRIGVPIIVTEASGLSEAGISRVEAVLSWRYTMLMPTGVVRSQNGATLEVLSDELVGDRRVVRVGISGVSGVGPGGRQVVGEIENLVLLGDRLETAITIDSLIVKPTVASQVTMSSEDGKFTVEGICVLDGDRLVQYGAGLKMNPLRPNPTSDRTRIEYILPESRNVEVRIYDVRGNLVNQLSQGVVDEGGHELNVDVTPFDQGLYYVELRAGGEVIRQSMIINR